MRQILQGGFILGAMVLASSAAAQQALSINDVRAACKRDQPFERCSETASGLIESETAAQADKAAAYFQRALWLHLDGRDDAAAIADYTAAIDLRDRAVDHFNRAMLLRLAGDWKTAIEDLETAVDMKPDYGKAWVDLSRLYGERDRHQDAIDAAQSALKLDPTLTPRFQSFAWFNIGNNAFKIRQDDLALEATLNAVKANPKNAGAHRNLVRIYAERGENDLAKEAYAKAAELQPNSFHLLRLKGLLKD